MVKKNVIVGISAFYHDSACCVIKDGEIICAAQEERFTRKKHDPSFPVNALKWCIQYAGVNKENLLSVVFYDKPLLKFERILETYYAFAPKGLKSFLTSMPVWIKEKVFLKKILRDSFNRCAEEVKSDARLEEDTVKVLFPEHHLSHAASAFFPSPFKKAAILTIDGVGEWATGSICRGNGNQIEKIKEIKFPHSLGLLYSAFTYYCGFKVNSGEYKLMGLAPYGDPDNAEVIKEKIYRYLIDVKDDGSIWMNMNYFDYATGLKMVKEKEWEKIFGFPPRKYESEIDQIYCDMALAIQKITEDIVSKMANHAKELTGEKKLVLAGGVALNCVSNGKILMEGPFDDIWIQPAAGDAGGALGGAFSAWHIYYGNIRDADEETDKMKGSFLGPSYSNDEVESTLRKFNASYKKISDFDELARTVAKLLAEGNVVGWFQGKMEWGPRALGARSILGDARNPDAQKHINLKIKYRESFRPFAPSVIEEDAEKYFKIKGNSPYMLLIAQVREELRKPLPEGYWKMPLREKLYITRSTIPAITHIDFSARLQTVSKKTNERFWKLINSFKELTGCSVIINTSFNVRGEPIVMSPEHAYTCFMRTEMDVLVMEDFILYKKDQPPWREKRDWKRDFVLD